MRLNERGTQLLREWQYKYSQHNAANGPEIGTEILDHLVTNIDAECGWMLLTYDNGPYGNDALGKCEEWLVYGDHVIRGNSGYTVSQLMAALQQYFDQQEETT